jgi:hypothetical protein
VGEDLDIEHQVNPQNREEEPAAAGKQWGHGSHPPSPAWFTWAPSTLPA